MTLTIALTPPEEVRLAAVTRQEGIAPAEADCLEPRTLAELASARQQFLASLKRTPLEADLPAVLLSEG